ncbi:hypothetical protein ACLMJK_007801 [Lecanora helva]
MASICLSGYQLVILLSLFMLCNISATFKFSRAKTDSELAPQDLLQDVPKSELVSLVRTKPEDPSGTFAQALELLASLQTSPSCNRLAASSLLDSCQSIEDSQSDAEEIIEDYRSIYAAQLALCEIGSANPAMPQSCDQLVAVTKSRGKGTRSVHKDRLNHCLQSLESRPQWWTSYSNNRQNAGVMCQAARIDIEKGQLHKSMVETNAEASSALGRATKQANSALEQLQSDFTLARNAFQTQLHQELESSSEQVASFLGRLLKSMETAIHGAMGQVLSSTKDITSETAILSQNVRQANTESNSLRKTFAETLQQVADRSSELVTVQTKQWDESNELATQLQNSLQDIHTREISTLVAAVYGMRDQLQASTEMVVSLHKRQNALDERLLHLGDSFDGLESKADVLHAAQNRQVNMQAYLHNQTESMMQNTRLLLDEVVFSANNLKITVESSSAIIGRLAYITNITRWIPLIGMVIMVLWMLYMISPKYAGCMAIGIIMLSWIRFSGIEELLQPVLLENGVMQTYQEYTADVSSRTPAGWPIIICVFAFIIVIIRYVFYQLTSFLRSPHRIDPDLSLMDKAFSERSRCAQLV